MNRAIIIGNLTKDPELRTSNSSDTKWCTFTVAVNRRRANQQGVREADFFNVVAWRQLGETCARYLTKGSKVCVEGSIQFRSYDAQDGTKRFVTELIAEDVEFLPSQNRSTNSSQGGYSDPSVPQEPAGGYQQNSGFTEVDDDELPF